MDDRSRDPFSITIGGTRDSRAHLRVVDHKFYIGKEEYTPYIAEMHYFQVAKRHWSVCFERIRKANFRIISTAVPWNLHEARQGEFDFAGTSDPATDLVVFLELCREFGFKIVLRPGPWIGQEWDRGGIPEFAARTPEMVATDVKGEPIIADPGAGARTVQLPSYLGGRFQIQLKNYFSVLTEVVRNYIYPRGPVFMIELDHETSFGRHFDPLSADFNPKGSLAAFGEYLAERYQELDHLNRAWKTKFKDFTEATPIDSVSLKTSQEFLRVMDWIGFREWIINRYAASLAEMLSQTEVLVLFARSLAFHGPYHFPNTASSTPEDRTVFTVNLDWDTPFADTIRRARAVSGWQATGICTGLAVGSCHPDAKAGHAYRPITPADTRRMIVAALAAGINGINFHMFVGRPRWYDSALESDGAVGASFDVVDRALTRLIASRHEIMRDFADVALVQYRPYQRIATLGEQGEYSYLADLSGPSFNAVAADLMALSYDYRLFNLESTSRLDKYGTIIVPCGEMMDTADQERLLELYKGGAHLILYGLLPKTDTRFEPCEILAKGIGFRTVAEGQIATVDAKRHGFQSLVYGSIRRAPARAVKLAKVGTKLVGASNRVGKGSVTVLTFSPGSLLYPEKLVFFREVLHSGKLQTPVFSSDPRTHVVLQGHAKAGLLMVYHTAETVGVPDGISDSPNARGVIVGADVSVVGLSAPRIGLTNVFTDETIKMTPKELKSGIEIRIGRGDSRLFLIDKQR